MLDTLPDDILYIIFSHLDTAKSIRSLLLTNKRLQRVIDSDDQGWRIFVRARFPSVSVPLLPSSAFTWRHLADSLTWQTRAWDRRSLSFQALMPTRPPNSNRRGGRARLVAPFHPILDAHLDLASKEELVVWGAGENLIARRRQGRLPDGAPEKTVWHRLDGKDLGYVAGHDDYKALSIVEDVCGRAGDLGVLVGQDSGHLALRSVAEANFGEKLADFHPQHCDSDADDWPQETINSVDVLRGSNVVASTTRFGISLYNLPDSPNQDVAPSAHLTMPDQGIGIPRPTFFQAKWMGQDTLAFGLSGSGSPLRYVKTTPTGFSDITLVKNANLEERFAISYNANSLCHGSLTPIDKSSILGGGGGENLLLSSWRDGTIRLQDLRTPSPIDLVYCDNIDPWAIQESLLPFGTSHFVTGGAGGASIKIFDFRWPRPYHHTSALPCSSEAPLPRSRQPFLRAPPDPGPCIPVCRPYFPSSLSSSSSTPFGLHGSKSCRWHELSRSIYNRPNGAFFFSKSLPREDATAGVWSLARASASLSPNFYIGISGGVIEASLSMAATAFTDWADLVVDPHLGYRLAQPAANGNCHGADIAPASAHATNGNDTTPHQNSHNTIVNTNADDEKDTSTAASAQYTRYNLDASLMEIGDGLLNKHNDRNVRLPTVRGQSWRRREAAADNDEESRIPEDFVRRHRLDPRYHVAADFEDALAAAAAAAAVANGVNGVGAVNGVGGSKKW
ncbi:hypothetical protein BD289DRAFT_421041 [Coniella lustricola]|uniref:F-box domain-containing protein n=1 Tax=Coniella lustricola TaxID=2025994 RepID=A0A2T3ALV1_9PEZI|nr:hypothetical protein BD289DRAFT_421041 [Coniella lustricola]